MNATTYSNYDTYTAEKLMERKRKSRKIKEDRQAVVGAVIGSFAMIADCETPYINQALREYMDEEIERITPLDNAMEIILK